MGWLNHAERRVRLARRLRLAMLILAGYIAAAMVDRSALRGLLTRDLMDLEGTAFYQVLRTMGSLVPWLIAGLVVLMHDRIHPPGNDLRWKHLRGLNLTLAPLLGGAAAELLKRVVGRERPLVDPALYSHKGLFAGFIDDSDLGWPSSHAAVAFAGAIMAWQLWPRFGPCLVLLAIGCGWTRMTSGAHYLTDVYAAFVVGYCCARAIRPLRLRPWALPGR